MRQRTENIPCPTGHSEKSSIILFHEKQIFNELCGIYGPQTILMRTVFRWVKAFKARKLSVEDDTRPGSPKPSVTKANSAAVKIMVEQDARLSVKDIRRQCAKNSEKAFGPEKGLRWVGTSFAH